MACCVPNCKTRVEERSSGISFHEFPTNYALLHKWLANVRLGNWTPNMQYARVCSRHFKTSDYKEGKKFRLLKPGTVPTLFLPPAPPLDEMVLTAVAAQGLAIVTDSSTSAGRSLLLPPEERARLPTTTLTPSVVRSDDLQTIGNKSLLLPSMQPAAATRSTLTSRTEEINPKKRSLHMSPVHTAYSAAAATTHKVWRTASVGGSSKLCLRWNHRETSVLTAFEQFLSDEAFVDVTLACEGLSLTAHKMVLSACSPFFHRLLSQNPCKHPIVILSDVHYLDLKAIVEFMYRGEVWVSQDQLPTLLKAAETLQVKGLTEVAEKSGGDTLLSTEALDTRIAAEPCTEEALPLKQKVQKGLAAVSKRGGPESLHEPLAKQRRSWSTIMTTTASPVLKSGSVARAPLVYPTVAPLTAALEGNVSCESVVNIKVDHDESYKEGDIGVDSSNLVEEAAMGETVLGLAGLVSASREASPESCQFPHAQPVTQLPSDTFEEVDMKPDLSTLVPLTIHSVVPDVDIHPTMSSSAGPQVLQ